MKVKDIASLIERHAPLQLQEDYDNSGLQIGDPDMQVSGVVTTLDVTEQTVRLCAETGANVIVSHHPLLFRGVKQINPQRDYISRVIISAISHGIAIYSAHTNLDNAWCGVNYKIGEVLGLKDVCPLAPLSQAQTAGLEHDFAVHCGSGIVGELSQPMSANDFLAHVCRCLKLDAVSANTLDYDGHPVSRVALCGGAGADFIGDALRAKADAYITGEVSYHLFFTHPEMLMLSAGHFETEQFTSDLLADIIRSEYPDLQITVAPKSSPIEQFIPCH
ncbi:MAG: Nif3-like dinuclear metal center hexameric protein [Bacteroidales bacterium]|nr:Nif3-like dinuclear metal center hexameric protein [Candidatus Liminaster caballi]